MPHSDFDWAKYTGCQVRVYRNLRKKKMSVATQVVIDGKKKWKVVGHVQNCVLEDVELVVRESGRKAALKIRKRKVKLKDGTIVFREGRERNVHAWAVGTLVGEFSIGIETPIDLTYHPHFHKTFVERESDRPLGNCRNFVVRNCQVTVSVDALKVVADAPQTAVATARRQKKAIKAA